MTGFSQPAWNSVTTYNHPPQERNVQRCLFLRGLFPGLWQGVFPVIALTGKPDWATPIFARSSKGGFTLFLLFQNYQIE